MSMNVATITVVFDGEVLRPEAPLDLELNARYVITIQPEPTFQDAWDVLERYAGTVDAPADWSIEHDHYLYGTPKRHANDEGPLT